MKDAEEILTQLVECVEAAVESGDWKVDGANDPASIVEQAKRILKEAV